MAWRCSGKTNVELIENLFRNGLITSPRVRDAMLRVDRAHYAPSSPYEDSPQSIGHAATISAPHMHAHAAESLLPYLAPGSRVLDIGSGSGYLTHVLAELVFPISDASSSSSSRGDDGKVNQEKQVKRRGKVVGLEHISALQQLGQGNMSKSEVGRKLLRDGKVVFVKGDGRKGWSDDDGEESEKGWDAIHVGAAAVTLHEDLVAQLRCPGRLFIPVEDSHGDQHIWVVDKAVDGSVKKQKLFGVRYVPLTDAPTT